MHLSPRDIDKLILHGAGFLAQKRLARGLRLNYPESVALIAAVTLEFIRDGHSVAELMDLGRKLLGLLSLGDGQDRQMMHSRLKVGDQRRWIVGRLRAVRLQSVARGHDLLQGEANAFRRLRQAHDVVRAGLEEPCQEAVGRRLRQDDDGQPRILPRGAADQRQRPVGIA